MFRQNFLLRYFYMREYKVALLGFIILPLIILFMTQQFFNPIFLNQVSIGYHDDQVIQEVNNAKWVKVDNPETALKEGKIDMFVDPDKGLIIRTSQPQYAVYRMILGIPKVKSHLTIRSIEYLTPYFDDQGEAALAYNATSPTYEFVVNYDWVNSELGISEISQKVLFNGSYQMIIAMLFSFFLVYQRKMIFAESLFGTQPILMKKKSSFVLWQCVLDLVLLSFYSILVMIVLQTESNVFAVLSGSLITYLLFCLIDVLVVTPQGFTYIGAIVVIIALLLASTFVPTASNLAIINDLLDCFRYGIVTQQLLLWLMLLLTGIGLIKGVKYAIRSKKSM